MEYNPNKDLVQAIGKFSHLLVQQQLIDLEKDEKALKKAMSSVAQKILNPESISSSQSSLSFVKGPLVSMMTKYQLSQQKIEEKRNQQLTEELSQLQSKPTINKTSQKIVKTMPPLHLRTQMLIKEQEQKIESQRTIKRENENLEFIKTCTFKPLSRCGSKSRSPDVVTKELYMWNEFKQKKVEVKKKERERTEEKFLGRKPKIDNLSEKLCKVRCATPVYERLNKTIKRPWVKVDFSFSPSVNVKSKKILKQRSKSRECSPVRDSSYKSRQSSTDRNRHKGAFRINSSIGTYEQHFSHINQCKYTKEIPKLFT